MKKIVLCLALLSLTCLAIADEGHHHDMSAAELGAVSFSTSCDAKVQPAFNHGVAWLHSFEYEQARQEFARVAVADPKCAMAQWGMAMSLYHQLWEHPDTDAVNQASTMLAAAKKMKATPREQAYIAALSSIFTSADDEHIGRHSKVSPGDVCGNFRTRSIADGSVTLSLEG